MYIYVLFTEDCVSMKKTSRKILSVVLAVCLAACCFSCVAAAVNTAEEQYPSIVIPGIFQSEVKMYDGDGNVMFNSDGEEYSAPFFLEGTSDIVKYALEQALLPLGSLLLTQKDFENRCADAIAQTLGSVMMGNIALDEKGQIIKNIRATKYNTSCAKLPAHDVAYILNQIPLTEYVAEVGKENLYFFSYVSTGNMIDTANELYELIQTAKRESGKDRVNLVPISQGGSVFDALMQVYEDRGVKLSDDVHRVAFIVPAADGAAVLGDIYAYGLLDDDDALYGYMFPSLLDEDQEWLSYLINLILRLFPNADLNNILDTAVDVLANDYLKYSTLMWALIPSAEYKICAEKYLSDEGSAAIKEQTDWFYNAQTNARSRILEYKDEGVEFFDIVDYDYTLYKICDSWDKTNADGIIHTDSESFGATAAPVGCCLPADYTQQNTYCTCPGEHNHTDGTNTLDASTGILCETTFYFKYQNHEQTAKNSVIIDLATRILTDDTFTDVYSDAAYPQFNFGRHTSSMRNAINRAKAYSGYTMRPETRAEYEKAIADCEEAYASTVMDTNEFNARRDRLERITDEIAKKKDEDAFKNGILGFMAKILKFFSDIMLKFFAGKGFSDIILFR